MADTIVHRLHENARTRPNAPAYYEKIGDSWVPTSWEEYTQQVRQAARALTALGLGPGDNVSILGFNRPEWVIMDLANMLIGGAPTGIYTTNSPHECKYIIEHAETKVVLVENEHQWDKIAQVRSDVGSLERIVTMRGVQVDDEMTLDWDSFLALGDEVEESVIDERMAALEDDQLATLIYTSGTTGPPKGVMLSHKNLARTAVNARELFGIKPSDRAISYLPLSHIAEQLLTVHGPPTSGYAIYFAQYPPQDHLVSNLQEVQPTLIFGVPRIWEKFQAGVAATLSQATGTKAKLVNWARNVGSRVTELRNRGEEPSGTLAMQYKLASKLVFSKVKAGLGLGQARIMLTAAAPISPEILYFFGSLDLIVHEVYGQSEGTGLTTANVPGANKVGTVGRAWPETEVKIADDGEIVFKGPNVFLGYFKDPEATASDLQDGWLHSGDLGEMDEDGYVKIVGRKKEIIITSGGKNIAPKNIEAALKDIDLIAQAVVIGEQRRYITALLTLDEEHAAQFAREHGLEGKTLHDNAVVIDYVQMQIDEKVNTLFARVEQVRKFTILPRDFTVEDGELTPTLKIKRRVVNEHFAENIEAMYEE